MPLTRTNSKIEAEYRARTRRSAELYERARKVIPAGVTHDSRTLLPFPIYVARATGPRKWDVDGNEYVDYFGGHGALLLGHGHPQVVEAVREQAPNGTHYGACHELEVRWAELVNRLIPCAERVRFTGSGTEATMLALRLARAFTGQAEGRELRRPLPRLARRRRRRAPCRLTRAACRPAFRPAWSSRPSCCRPTTSQPRGRDARGARRHGGGDPRADGRVVGPGAAPGGFLAGAARGRRARTASC